jgi:hypothetical protein
MMLQPAKSPHTPAPNNTPTRIPRDELSIDLSVGILRSASTRLVPVAFHSRRQSGDIPPPNEHPSLVP